MRREIILDTETTGMDPARGDRIIEIGCLELLNLVPSGRTFHHYLDPGRDVPAEASAVHGITSDMLKGKPSFVGIAADLVEFIGESPIVAHNASFDAKFINAELAACGFPPYGGEQIIDTLVLARRQAPGAPASLDALCKRFGIDNSARTQHGALLDAQLLAEVYLELCGGRQPDLVLGDTSAEEFEASVAGRQPVRPPRPHAPSEAERAAHAAFIAQLADPLWNRTGS